VVSHCSSADENLTRSQEDARENFECEPENSKWSELWRKVHSLEYQEELYELYQDIIFGDYLDCLELGV